LIVCSMTRGPPPLALRKTMIGVRHPVDRELLGPMQQGLPLERDALAVLLLEEVVDVRVAAP
jgi:hypothetical protein